MGSLLVLVFTPPYTENIETAISLVEAALEKGHECHIHLIQDGVHSANKNIQCEEMPFVECSYAKRLQELIQKGAIVSLCPVCANYRGLLSEDYIKGVEPRSLSILVEDITESNVIISLGG